MDARVPGPHRQNEGTFRTGKKRLLGWLRGCIGPGQHKKISGRDKNQSEGDFTDPEVLSAAGKFADQTAYSLGQISGSAASIGLTIADNLLGGFSLFLEQNNSRYPGISRLHV